MRSKTVLTLTVIASVLCMLAVGVEAQRGRRGRRGGRQAAAPAAPPNSAAIAEALGELRWGMEPRQVHQYFVQQIQQRYRPRLAKAPGSIEEDRLRREMDDEVRRLRESYVRFEGSRTGWDLSFLRGEFTHGNQESMLVYRDENSQNFYFFIGGRLWKWYKAFDASVFQGQGFEQFAGAVQGRFGQAAERSGRLVEDGPQQRWLEWQDSATRLRAIDQTHFYGFYCLVFEDKGVLDRIDTLRTHTVAAGGQGGHALVDSVILPEDGDTGSQNEGNADIADRITGRVRRVQQAPTKAGGGSGGSGSSGASGSSGSSGSSDSSSGSTRRRGSDNLDLSDL
jgi:hypothetical protein